MEKHSLAKFRRPRVDDRRMWDVYLGACGFFAVHVAHSVGVFKLLVERPRTLAEICQALGLKRRPAEAILSVSTSHELLELRDSRYALTATAEDYLLSSSPTYFGGQLDWNLAHSEIITLDRLRQAVLTDRPQAYGTGEQIFKTHEEEAEVAKQFRARDAQRQHGSCTGVAGEGRPLAVSPDARRWRRLRRAFDRRAQQMEEPKRCRARSPARV